MIVAAPSAESRFTRRDDTPGKTWSVGTLTYTTTGLVVLFCWLLWGDFAWAMKDRAIPPIVQTLLQKFGTSDMFAGLLFGSLPPALGLILGPIIAYKSDRHRGRWGRRIPYLLISTPIALFGIAGLACSPKLGEHLDKWLGPHSWGLNSCVLGLLALCWMLFEFSTTIANAVYGALINDVVPQPVLGRFYGIFRALSLVVGIIFFLGMPDTKEPPYVLIFLAVGAIYGIGVTLMCFNVKEGEYPPQPPMDAGRNVRGAIQAVKTYFQECFGNTYYWWLFGSMAVATIATGPVNLFSIFFAGSIHMDLKVYWNCLAVTYSISLVMAYPLGWLADRFHPLRVAIVALGLYALVALWGGLFIRDAQTLPSRWWQTCAIALVARRRVNTAIPSLMLRLLPKAEFAQFASAGGILTAVAWMLLAPVSGFLLDHLNHDYRYTFLMIWSRRSGPARLGGGPRQVHGLGRAGTLSGRNSNRSCTR